MTIKGKEPRTWHMWQAAGRLCLLRPSQTSFHYREFKGLWKGPWPTPLLKRGTMSHSQEAGFFPKPHYRLDDLLLTQICDYMLPNWSEPNCKNQQSHAVRPWILRAGECTCWVWTLQRSLPALSGCTYYFLCSVLRTLNGSTKNKVHLYLEAERFYLVLTHNLGVWEYCSCEFLWKKRWRPFPTSYQIRSLLLANGGGEGRRPVLWILSIRNSKWM